MKRKKKNPQLFSLLVVAGYYYYNKRAAAIYSSIRYYPMVDVLGPLLRFIQPHPSTVLQITGERKIYRAITKNIIQIT